MFIKPKPKKFFYSSQVFSGAAGAPSYTGPLDVVPGAIGFWSPFAGSSAGIGTNAVQLVRASDSSTQNFATQAGTGLVSTSAINTFLSATTGKFIIAYDQTVSANNLTGSSSTGLDYATTISSLPSMSGAAGTGRLLQAVTNIAIAQPYTLCAVAMRTNNFTTFQNIVESANAAVGLLFTSTANQVRAFSSTAINVSQTDSSPHFIVGVFNGASSAIYVDGVQTTGNAGTVALSSFFVVGSGGGAYDASTATIGELSLYSSALNSTQVGLLTTNVRSASRWNF